MVGQPRQTRRGALKSVAAIASTTMFHAACTARADSGAPIGRIDTAVIGIGERGKYLIANLPERFRVTALCDCSRAQVETALRPPERFANLLASFGENDAPSCRIYQDYRKMLEQQKFDAVVVAAPDHHHALASILAMQAGAHVYVEKPLAVTIAEGRAMVDASVRYGRIVQVGSQQRTMQVNRTACEFIRDGGLGKVTRVEERNYPGPIPYDALERWPTEKIPATLDWDLFCGPTPLRPYHKNLWVKDAFDFGYLRWRGWDLFEDYSGHLMTNWGAHSLDMIQFALGQDGAGPASIELRKEEIDPFIDDRWHDKTPPLGTVPNDRVDRLRFSPLVMAYPEGVEVYFRPGTRRTVFYGEKGTLFLGRNHYRTEPVDLLPPPDPIEMSKWSGSGHVARPHLQNWLDAIEKDAPLNAPLEVGHRSATVCHLANLARRLDRKLTWDSQRERFVGDHEADQHLARPRRKGFELPASG